MDFFYIVTSSKFHPPAKFLAMHMNNYYDRTKAKTVVSEISDYIIFKLNIRKLQSFSAYNFI